MRKGHISLLLCDFAYIMTFLRFQREPSDFTSKYGILGGSRRRAEVRGSPRHQEQAGALKIGNARPCIKAHGRAPKEPPASATRKMARPHRAWWHDCATTHGWPCAPRTAVRGVVRRGVKSVFAILFGAFFIPPFFLVFPLAFRVLRGWLERVQTLRFSLNLCFWIEDCEDSRINLHSPSIYASLFSFPFLFDL